MEIQDVLGRPGRLSPTSTDPCLEGSMLQRQGVGHCKNGVLALGVSLLTETLSLLKGCKSNFLDESSMDLGGIC